MREARVVKDGRCPPLSISKRYIWVTLKALHRGSTDFYPYRLITSYCKTDVMPKKHIFVCIICSRLFFTNTNPAIYLCINLSTLANYTSIIYLYHYQHHLKPKLKSWKLKRRGVWSFTLLFCLSSKKKKNVLEWFNQQCNIWRRHYFSSNVLSKWVWMHMS